MQYQVITASYTKTIGWADDMTIIMLVRGLEDFMLWNKIIVQATKRCKLVIVSSFGASLRRTAPSRRPRARVISKKEKKNGRAPDREMGFFSGEDIRQASGETPLVCARAGSHDKNRSFTILTNGVCPAASWKRPRFLSKSVTAKSARPNFTSDPCDGNAAGALRREMFAPRRSTTRRRWRCGAPRSLPVSRAAGLLRRFIRTPRTPSRNDLPHPQSGLSSGARDSKSARASVRNVPWKRKATGCVPAVRRVDSGVRRRRARFRVLIAVFDW